MSAKYDEKDRYMMALGVLDPYSELSYPLDDRCDFSELDRGC